MKSVVIIGSTGSIGTQTVDVCLRHKDEFNVVGLIANQNEKLLIRQSKLLNVEHLGLFSGNIDNNKNIIIGEECYDFVDKLGADIIIIAASGVMALPYVERAIKTGNRVAIANKETLVCAGEYIMPLVKKYNAEFIPVDSEHSAIWQSLHCGNKNEIKRILLTASGGSFRDTPISELKNVTVEQTLKHPNWNMGSKITVDSATMFNKGLEVIEAKWLFNVNVDNIEVVVHRESVLHSAIEFSDGAIVGEMSYPTMEIPIQLALSYPRRLNAKVEPLDLFNLKKLSFEKLDNEKFPAVNLAKECVNKGGIYPAIMNSANEVMVARFLNKEIGYLDIYKNVVKVLENDFGTREITTESILQLHKEITEFSRRI